MNISRVLGGGGSWGSSFRTDSLSARRTAAPGVSPPTPDTVRERLDAASAALRAAFGAFTTTTRPIYTRTLSSTLAPATLAGLGARLSPFDGGNRFLKSTISVNTETSTNRSSSQALGLDLTTAVSELGSAELGLDITSPAAASRLDSSAPLGLDLVSADRASVLRSALAVGLDVTSAESASSLASSSALGLDVASPQGASTIASTAEINTAATSYAPSVSFSAGTAVATLSGTFTGVNTAAGATSLTIRMRTDVTLDSTAQSLHFEVLDQTGATLVDRTDTLRAGDPIYLGDDIGLFVTFSAGTAVLDDTGTAAVTHTATDVDTAAIFNAANPNLRPRFENGAQVTAGAFTINGTSIAINADDSIDAVVARINGSEAGVIASFAGDRLTLTTEGDSEDHICLANDTSGFLAATKLSAAVTSRGNIHDDQQALAKTTQFGSVATGAFTINGRSISVNRDTDTLSSIVTRINGAGAGVTAAYDPVQDRLVLTGTSDSEDLISVAGDTSGFLTAAGLSTENTVRGNVRDDQQVLSQTTQFAGVASGSFTVNGVSISVDKDTDTLASVVSRINGAGAGVTAAYDSATDRLVLTGTTNSQDLIEVANDTSGFLSAAHLQTGDTVRGHLAEDGVALENIDEFQSVTSGSFEVDGQTITVDIETDTIRSLLEKINASGARVSGSYDADSDTITLQAAYDSEDDVPIGNDSSGFLAAAHLDAGATVRGNIRDDEQVLAKTAQFAGVASGSFTIDGCAISVDRDADTLSTLVNRINGAGAGVTASYDSGQDKLILTSTSNSEDLITVGGDTSGFLAAAGLSSGNTVRGKLADHQQALATTSQFAGVTDGSFSANGVSISVDADADSLAAVIARINGAGAGVTARYDVVTDKVIFTPDVAGARLSLDDDTSGFLAAARVATGSAGTRANADGAFNGTGANAPLFDSGVAVQAGSFTVNGVAIGVAADDSITTVLGKITASAAGVTASYDGTTQTVTLTTKAVTAGPITLGDDTSGFLAAVKLDGTASTGRASISAFDGTLDGMVEYADVQAGTVTVNGHAITIDPATTTIRGLVEALNDLDDVSATLNSATGMVLMASQRQDGALTVSDTSGVLSKLGVAAGTYSGYVGSTTVVETKTGTATSSNAAEVAAGVSAAIQQFNDVVAQLGGSRAGSSHLHSGVKAAIQDTIDALRHAGISGLRVKGDGEDLHVSVLGATLAASLEGLASQAGPGAAISESLDRLADGLKASATAPDAEPAPPVPAKVEISNAARAQFAARKAVTSMLLLEPVPQPPNLLARKVANAYAGGSPTSTGLTSAFAGSARPPALLDRVNGNLASGTRRQPPGTLLEGPAGVSGRPAIGSDPGLHSILRRWRTWGSWLK